jgi:hypothetical protein
MTINFTNPMLPALEAARLGYKTAFGFSPEDQPKNPARFRAAAYRHVFGPETPKWSRIPTPAEIAAFTGLHCSSTYARAVAVGWRCPCCGRNAHELIRWSFIKNLNFREQFGDAYGMGFTISMALHHDHSADGVGQQFGVGGRFPPTLICGDCNSADGAVKLKLGLPGNFSFSSQEIARFVRCQPHSGRTEIDYDKAAGIATLLGVLRP